MKPIVGIAWFKEEDYLFLRDIFQDGHALPATYAEWLQKAKGLFDNLSQRGFNPVKVYIDPDTFLQWCRENGRSLDAKARTAYVNFILAKKFQSNHQ